ncbi:MAG TPA: ArgE/DapE family deacylase [Terriglobia bacterium]|nr:ArgE/DapE family deacylase [Terriglobia bacterium]
MNDRNRVADILADLVKIESINPELVPGGSGEAKIAAWVADFLRLAGLKTRIRKLGHGRANIVGVLRGRGGGRSLMLNGHLDTVGVAGMEAPFSAEIKNNRLYGRGAQDMKGGIAAALMAAAVLAEGPRLRGDVLIAAVADEEYKSLGTRALLEEITTDAAIVMEPTGLEVATAHKGFVWAEIESLGKAAHGSRPQEGLDAIAMMGRVLGGIEILQKELEQRPPHPLLGHGSVHASIVSGGQELSSYPARCLLSVERRLLPGEDASIFKGELDDILSDLCNQDRKFRARIRMGYSALALETARESPIAQTLMACARKVVGPSAKFGAQSFWTDAALLNQAGIASILFGPGGAGMHSTVEYVNLPEIAQCADALVECAQDFCGV